MSRLALEIQYLVLVLIVGIVPESALAKSLAQHCKANSDIVEQLRRGTNIHRQQTMLNLCIFLDNSVPLARIDEIVHALIPLVRDPDPLTRSLAIEVLSRVGDEARPAIPALVNILGDREGCAGLLAVTTLANLGATAVPPLMKALKHPDMVVRQLAATTLGEIGPKARQALPALKAARKVAREQAVRERIDSAIRRISGVE